MSVDANGRTHRPKGLPKGVAGTFGASAAARGDADLDESPYRLDGNGSRAEAMRLADEWFGAGDDRPPTGGSPVHTVVNRNTGGLLLVSDKGRVVDALRSAWTTTSISASATTGMSIPADCRACGAACSTRRGRQLAQPRHDRRTRAGRTRAGRRPLP